MYLEKEQVMIALQQGTVEAVNAAKSEIHLIADQINLGLDDNDVKKVQYTVDLHVKISVDTETKKIRAKGGYGGKTANLSKWGNEVEMEIDDPNQPAICGNCGKQDCQLCSKDPETNETGDCSPEEE